jgi:hypothetical protein
MDKELQHDGDDDLSSSFNTEMDDLSLCSFDNEDMDSSSSTTPSSSSPQQLMMMPTHRSMPVLQKPNDVCFKSCRHPGTVRWRAIVKTYSGQYSEWKDEICTKVREDLALENITTFLVNLDPQGQLTKKIKDGLWYEATDEEILARTKERFVEDRKQRINRVYLY